MEEQIRRLIISRRTNDRASGLANASEAGAARAYVELLWDLAKAEQEALVFKVRVQHIEKQIKEVIDSPYGPGLTENETQELSTWRKEMRPKMRIWVAKSDIKNLQDKCTEIYEKYAEARRQKSCGVYEAPRFVINCLESQERIDIQREFDVNREFLIMTNPEVEISHQQINALRTAAGRGRAVYRGCSLIKPEFSVEKELEALQAAGDAANDFEVWVPGSVARLAQTDSCGTPLTGSRWNEYFSSLGYMRLEQLLITPAQPLPPIATTSSPSLPQPTPGRSRPLPTTPPQRSVGRSHPHPTRPQPPVLDDDETESDDSDDGEYGYLGFNSAPSAPPPPQARPRNVSPWVPRHLNQAPFPPPAPLRQNVPAPAPPPAPQFQQPHQLPLHPAPLQPFQQPHQLAPYPAPPPAYNNPPVQPPQPPPPAPINPNQPVNRHGRPVPYNPTPQPVRNHPTNGVPTKWNKVRGNAPGNIDVYYWDKMFNRSDSNYNKSDRIAAKTAREDGTTRDLAIDELIRVGMLPQGFRDVNP
ncbi:hypothetical protein BKA64DRAFT_721705 [Cadophora sp. MPI-SDFR-AT-0126]|nr:hypothetical protein BKA64DRAFT_721705 [Leotiomycetes sp. MPI-SDFR-AT-0126]